jgi:hypothetical protein
MAVREESRTVSTSTVPKPGGSFAKRTVWRCGATTALCAFLLAEICNAQGGQLMVVTMQPQCRLLVDGTEQAVTGADGRALIGNLTPGTHRVEVQKLGCVSIPSQQQVTISEDIAANATFQMICPPPTPPPTIAEVIFEANMSGVTIWVDRQYIGITDNGGRLAARLAHGRHTLQYRMDMKDYGPFDINIEGLSQRVPIHIVPPPSPGAIALVLVVAVCALGLPCYGILRRINGPLWRKTINKRFKVGRRIGRGAFASVHLGRDRATGKVVALKIMLPEIAGDSEEREVFLREGPRLRDLNEACPAAPIVKVIAWDIIDDPQLDDLPFIAMERLRGQPLRREKRLPADKARRVVIDVLRALKVAHDKGWCHGDATPENIIVSDGRSRPSLATLIDFGAASHSLGLEQDRNPIIVGKRGYIAPEVLDGGIADARSDIYSLGCVFYELLTGTPPCHEWPPFPLNSKDFREVVRTQKGGASPLSPNIVGSLRRIALKMLEYDANKRYQNAGEVLRDLKQ